MRALSQLMVLLIGLIGSPALADPRGDCIAKCAAIASPCGVTARKIAETCRLDANKACATAAPADKFKCLTSGLKPCGTARNAAAQTCFAALKTCHAACGPAPAGQADFWCETEIGGGAKSDYHYDVCAGTPGKSGEDQARDCARKVAVSLPGAAGQTCDQIN